MDGTVNIKKKNKFDIVYIYIYSALVAWGLEMKYLSIVIIGHIGGVIFP